MLITRMKLCRECAEVGEIFEQGYMSNPFREALSHATDPALLPAVVGTFDVFCDCLINSDEVIYAHDFHAVPERFQKSAIFFLMAQIALFCIPLSYCFCDFLHIT